MNGRPWTSAELAILRRDYPTVASAELAQRLSRSLLSVCKAAERRGVEKTRTFRTYEGFSPQARGKAEAARRLRRWRAGTKGLSSGYREDHPQPQLAAGIKEMRARLARLERDG